MTFFKKVVGALRNPQYPPTPPLSIETEILPHSVGQALQYKGAEIGPGHIRELMVPARRMQRFGAYAALKASDGNEALQVDLLQKLAGYQFDMSKLTVDDIAAVLDDMEQREHTVMAKKLAEVSLKGFGAWVNHFNRQLDDKLNEDTPVFTLAYSTLIGLDGLAKATHGGGRPLHILNPNAFDDHTRVNVGYVISPDGRIEPLPRDFKRPDGAIIIDDIENSGKARQKAEAFWGEGANYVPLARLSSPGNLQEVRHNESKART